ncbi:MAG TPA: hypothetical protein VGI82_10105 [Chitinophagaceae bacterium]|jgi:hypothetical protein
MATQKEQLLTSINAALEKELFTKSRELETEAALEKTNRTGKGVWIIAGV